MLGGRTPKEEETTVVEKLGDRISKVEANSTAKK